MTTLGAFETNRVYCCDALELLSMLPDNCVDLVVTSPPYNMGTNTNGAKAASETSDWGGSKLLSSGYENFADAMPHSEYIAWQRTILQECIRIIKPTGAVFYNHKWRIQGGLLDMRSEIVDDFPLRQVIIWNRGATLNHKPTFFPQHYEVVYLFAGRDFRRTPAADKFGDVWNIAPITNSTHPAPFPERLVERCLLSCYGDLVIDPFMGSGTTAAVAQRMGWQYIGSDVSLEYCELARKRLDAPYTMPMFVEGLP